MSEPDPGLRVRWAALGAAFLAVGTVSAVLLRWWQSNGGDLPQIPLLLAALLAIVGAVVLVLGLRVRRWVSRGEHVDPIGATRTLVLGQTAALAGAVLAGYLTASLGLASMQLELPEPRQVALASGVGLLAAVAMAVAGMVTQWCCRVPPEDEDGDDRYPDGTHRPAR
ncbi:DUF3180 domain-containing protein [Pseudactinotalea suaedae]|uniref:DUF3180 domain-containing protein n=1 Tax=Pseudactinotalea suaedae TaxID=1524924 RepID=UPI0012E21F19|nr:DUF3180 domain-containing protein [Pseudactinotalea suaedae]